MDACVVAAATMAAACWSTWHASSGAAPMNPYRAAASAATAPSCAATQPQSTGRRPAASLSAPQDGSTSSWATAPKKEMDALCAATSSVTPAMMRGFTGTRLIVASMRSVDTTVTVDSHEDEPGAIDDGVLHAAAALSEATAILSEATMCREE